MRAAALLSLLQLASPALPIGAYSYSQGLEAAFERGLVVDAAGARDWIAQHLRLVLARWEAPLCWRLMQAFAAGDDAAVRAWNERFIASRDSAEMRAETIQMGYSLSRLLAELEPDLADAAPLALLRALPEVALPSAYGCAVVALAIPPEPALLALLFAWAENQVLVCVKSVPLGQVAGQRLLLSLGAELEQAACVARTLADDALSNWSPGLALLSMRHEAQYSRLYRS